MKKTLLGVLAFVLVLVTLLTGTVFAADGDTANTQDVGVVKKLADGADPIVVDGKMDEAYTQATPLLINTRTEAHAGVYTYGWARFVWSEADNALYCLVLINDAETNPRESIPWRADSVELFIGWNGTNKQAWGIDKLKSEDGVLKRGLQYRIDGYDEETFVSCFLEEECLHTDNYVDGKEDYLANTYFFDEESGRLVNDVNNNLINENKNIFGWKFSTDKTKTGWGNYRFSDGEGYMVEYRIECPEGKLKAGSKILFDLQVNDRFGVGVDNTGKSVTLYYSSAFRKKTGDPRAGGVMTNYDYFTLSDETVGNKTANEISEQELTKYGKADPNIEYKEEEHEQEISRTEKKTVSRDNASRVTGNVTTKPTGGNDGGDDTSTTTKKPDTDPGTTVPANGGGCGSSIAVGTSVAMIALVGATGFFAFRRKDEE